MPFSHEFFKPVVTACPFLPQPCIAGDVQGFECRQLVKQGDPIARFRDDTVIYCTVCQKEITLSSIPRSQMRLDKT